jgi:DNA-binding SARP family transcriptional activator
MRVALPRRMMRGARNETTGTPAMNQHIRHAAKEHRAIRRNHVTIRLLGGFEVSVDGAAIPDRRWSRRRAASLVKLLALAPGNRLHREQVIDILWPEDSPADAAPRLHKAAHYARKATGCRDAVVLRNDVVQLFPTAHVAVDVVTFEELARRAITDNDRPAARAAADHYGGELLPDDRYEEWAAERRELLRLRHLNVLRLAGDWLAVTEVDHGDEQAHVELIRDHVATGDAAVALAHYRRLERVLDRDLGVGPGPVARQLLAAIEATSRAAPAPATPDVEDLVAELVELTRRQTDLLGRLAAASWAMASVSAAACA